MRGPEEFHLHYIARFSNYSFGYFKIVSLPPRNLYLNSPQSRFHHQKNGLVESFLELGGYKKRKI